MPIAVKLQWFRYHGLCLLITFAISDSNFFILIFSTWTFFAFGFFFPFEKGEKKVSDLFSHEFGSATLKWNGVKCLKNFHLQTIKVRGFKRRIQNELIMCLVGKHFFFLYQQWKQRKKMVGTFSTHGRFVGFIEGCNKTHKKNIDKAKT